MSTPFFNFTLSYPGNLQEPSFLDLTVSNNSLFPPGKRYTQTVDVTVKAVSDAPTGVINLPVSGIETSYVDGQGVTRWVRPLTLKSFSTYFKDEADKLQQFGTYNLGVADDVDTLKAVVMTGAGTYNNFRVLYDGIPLDFSNGKTHTISVEDIAAGKLAVDLVNFTHGVVYSTSYLLQDSGVVNNGCCYDGTIRNTSVHSPTPIGLDLNGDGQIGVTGATSSYQKDAAAALGRTVQFDIDADGKLDSIEWFDGSGDGILINNQDGNAALDMNGARLFGDQGGAYGNGYYKLALLDDNRDGQLSGAELKGLELWVDNGDAQVQAGEIQTLAQHGIASIGAQVVLTYDAEGKLHIESTATRTDGTTLMTEDVFFAAGPVESAELPALSQLLGQEGMDGLLGQVAPVTAAGNLAANDANAVNDANAALDFGHASELLQRIVAALQPMANLAEAAAA